MFDFKEEFHNVNSINGIKDGLIPFLITHLSQNNNIFYIAKNDLELSSISQFIKLNFEHINVFPFHHGIVYHLIFHPLIIRLLVSA